MIQLIEIRSMIEVGATELFAPRCQTDELDRMAADLEQMEAAHAVEDVGAFVEADVRFHRRILEGCGNPFVSATFGPISRARHDAREQTSAVPEIRVNAIAEHGNILAPLRSGSARAAAAAMRSHLDQTTNDALRHRPPPAAPNQSPLHALPPQDL